MRRTKRQRWEKARNAELEHFTEVNSQVVPQDRARDILSHWNIEFEYFNNKEVLSVGGGTGLVHLLSGSKRAISLDPLNNSIYSPIADDSEARGVTGAGENLPFPDNSFDIVISANVIDHTANPRKTVQEIARVMKPNSEFLFEVNIFSAHKLMRKLADYFDRPHPHHFDAVDIQELLLSSFNEVTLTSRKQIPFGASPAVFNQAKIFIAKVIFGLQKVYYVCQNSSISS